MADTLPCACCGATSTVLCAWPTEKPLREITVANLKVGDWIYPCRTFPQRREVVRIDNEGGFFTIYFAKPDGSPIGILHRLAFDAFAQPVSSTCDTPCCDAHHREVSEDRSYCREHWQLQDRFVRKRVLSSGVSDYAGSRAAGHAVTAAPLKSSRRGNSPRFLAGGEA
jgi:hypothetical protein